jgi:type IV pilus assembly protein PilY1
MYVCDQTGLSCQFVPCAGNYVILVSDGQWNTPDCSITPLGSDPCTSSSSDPVVPAYCMHKSFINKSAPNDSSGNPTTTRVNGVYTVGLFMGGSGITAMENTAMYGSFDNNLLAWPGGTGSFPVTTCSMTDCGSGSGSGCVAVPSSHADWDKDSNGVPDTFFSASNALEIKDSIITSILDILQQATSGTAVSILASGEGSGANLLQAFFYPRKSFSDTDVTWVGEMQNLWYYLDPKLQVNTIREDTDSDRQLELKNDNIVHFRFDTTLNKTRADRYKDVNGDGSTLMFQSTVDLEQTKNLWEAGKTLWSRNLSTSPRTLFTTTSSSYPFSQLAFSPSSAATLKNYLQAATNAEATDIINYVGGTDISGYRPRTAAISPDPTPKVWKLGDIVSSTPKVESWIKINGYNLDPPAGYGDDSYQKYLDSIEYKSRGMVFVGANDGMLHAFKLGSPVPRSSTTDKFLVSQLCDDINGNGKCDADELGTTLGQETWSYVPKNALPYLKYLGDPNYCHLFYVDETPYLVDASINMPSDCITGVNSTCPRKTIFTKDALGKDTKNLDMDKTSWRTIVIGGMGQGGACRKGTGGLCATGNCSHTISTSCSVDANCPAGERCLLNCVKTPIMDPSDNAKGLGYSSYFALDVTNPGTPSLLWEFSEANIPDANKGLGFSTSGPVIVRTGARDQNGNWYAVFASGPTGPIDTGLRQFLGKSDQNLKLFVLDLKTGALLRTIDTGLSNAFGGSLSGANVDTDRWRPDRTGNYQDDVFYVGYTQWSGTSWIGGVLRVSTKESDPGNWVASTVISGIGPVTSSVAHLQDRTHHSLWLFFGTGRYFYKIGTDIDDADSQRRIYGIKDPCYNADTDAFLPGCTSPAPGLTDSTTSPPSAEPDSGWFINLDPSGTSYTAEREITNPLAASTSAVFFTTFAPTADICGYGGNSYVWAVNYSTGGAPSATALQGSALIQVSTGEIKELSLSAVFTDKIPSGAPIGPGGIPQGRRTPAFSGVPPIKGAGLSVITNPRPVKKVLHMQER